MLTKELPLIFINNSQSGKGLTDEDAWTFTKIQQEKVERLEKAKHKTGKHGAGVTWGKENSDGSKVIEVWEKNTEGKEKDIICLTKICLHRIIGHQIPKVELCFITFHCISQQ